MGKSTEDEDQAELTIKDFIHTHGQRTDLLESLTDMKPDHLAAILSHSAVSQWEEEYSKQDNLIISCESNALD